MSLGVALYLAIFWCFTLSSLIEVGKSNIPAKIIEVTSDAGLTAGALAYWLPPVRDFLGGWVVLFYWLGIFLLSCILIGEYKGRFPDPEMDLAGNVFTAYFGSVLVAILYIPIVVWGFMAVVLRNYANT